MSSPIPAERSIFSAAAKVELVLMLALLALFLRYDREVAAWLTARLPVVQRSALGSCREPSEHEVLLISYVMRDGVLRRDGCTYAGSQSAYPKIPRQKVAAGKTHD